MKHAYLNITSRKWLFVVTIAAGLVLSPQGLMASPSVQVTQQSSVVKGQVVDATGEPIIGATIKTKGSGTGSITDLDGNFTLNASPGVTLEVSYIGYKTQEVKATAAPIRIILQEDSEMLEDVVVVGYGTMKRKNFTGSVSTVKTEDTPVALMPTSNVMDFLRGTATGLTVSQQQGAGQAPSIQVRGQKSISGGSDPLIVMDGVIFTGAYRDIDPNTIESMSILKDASSLAAYGSQAANGVIMITTKKGKVGKPVISFNTSWAFSSATCEPDVLSAEDYIKKVNLLNGLDEDADPTTWMLAFEQENYANGSTTDWFDYCTQTGLMQNYSTSSLGRVRS